MIKSLRSGKTRLSGQMRSGVALRCQLLASLLFVASNVFAQYEMVKDINTQPSRPFGNYSQLTSVGSITYYVANNYYFDSDGSTHLWRTDGTQEGTYIILSSDRISQLTPVGNKLYFTSYHPAWGEELFVSDGSKAGTVRVKDIYAGFDKSSSPQQLTAVGTTLYFSATDGISGRELYKSNGTAAGTVRVKDIIRGVGSSNPAELTNVNGVLYFTANDGINGYELWKSNGTDAGTIMVKDVRPGSKLSSTPKELTNVNGTLYFTAYDATYGRELWKSNGTAAGTLRVKDIRAGSSDSAPDNLTAVGSTLYFGAYTSANGRELWKSNGTATGTVLVKDISPGSSSPGGGGYPHLSHFTVFNGALYFMAYTDRPRIWKSNGTSAGTIPISPLNKHFVSIDPNLTVWNGMLWYVSNTNEGPNRGFMDLYKTDGTTTNHQLVKDRLGVWLNTNMELTPAGSKMFFTTWNTSAGDEEQIWYTDGTTAGTQPVDLSHYTYGSYPSNITTVGSYLYFIALGRDDQRGLYRSDGTAAGTQLIRVMPDSDYGYFYAAGSTLYFLQKSGGTLTLWKSDGTEAGTMSLGVVASDTYVNLSNVKYAFNNGILHMTLFYDNTSTHTSSLWRSDGTSTGTYMIRTFASQVAWMEKSGAYVLLAANDGVNGLELWRTDGTAAGTMLLKDIYPGAGNGVGAGAPLNGIVYFFGNNGADAGYEVWRSDGTTEGTYMFREGTFFGPMGYTKTNIFFFSDDSDPSDYDEVFNIWKSDGTTGGTSQIYTMPVWNESWGGPRYFTSFNGGDEWYFLTVVGYGPHELWHSDGTAVGTNLVTDFGPQEGIVVKDYAFAGDILYFIDVRDGYFVRSDGTECGTRGVPYEVEPLSSFSFEFMNLDVMNDVVYYPSYDPQAHIELHRFADNFGTCAATVASAGTDPESRTAGTNAQEVAITSYPNPFANEFRLNVGGDANATYHVTVTTMDGYVREELTGLTHNQDYTIGNSWAPGIYLLKITNEKGVTIRRVIKE